MVDWLPQIEFGEHGLAAIAAADEVFIDDRAQKERIMAKNGSDEGAASAAPAADELPRSTPSALRGRPAESVTHVTIHDRAVAPPRGNDREGPTPAALETRPADRVRTAVE